MDIDRRLGAAPQVAVRPEPFGALLYHFGTRRLSFLKDPRLLAVVRGLADASTARAACAAAGLSPPTSSGRTSGRWRRWPRPRMIEEVP